MSDLWWRIFKMKKEAKSPKAVAHKRKYETEYESSPTRVRNTDGSWRESVASAVSQVSLVWKRHEPHENGEDSARRPTCKQGALSSIRWFNTQNGHCKSTTDES